MDKNTTTDPQWFVSQESLPKRLNKNLGDNTSAEDILIEEGSFCDGKKVKNIPWADHFVIVSLRRDNQIIIPKGKMTLQANDLLTVVGDPEAISNAISLCNLQAENH
jgi:Trk K+ transport system NAD-binding subunit